MTWTSARHHGPAYCHEYTPLGRPILHNGRPVRLGPTAELGAILYANTPKATKDGTFRANFWKTWQPHVPSSIQSLDRCDFSSRFQGW